MKKILAILSSILFFTSCNKNLPDPGSTQVQSMANQWWVTYTVNGSDVLGIGHIQIATYDSSANNNELWIDDLGHGASGRRFKVKTTADLNNLTFSASGASNLSYTSTGTNPQTVTITNGKIIPGAAHAPASGVVADSIYMQATIGNATYTLVVLQEQDGRKMISK